MASELGGLAPTLIEAVARLCATFDRAHIQYAIIGGIAVGTRSRPRATNDVDVLLSVPQLALPRLLKDLIAQGFTLDERKAIEEFVQHHITTFVFHGVRIDWLKPVVPMYQHVLDRAVDTPVFGNPLRVATAEGLILLKLTAARPQDVADIAALLSSNRGLLDLAWIEQEWCAAFDADDPRWQRFQKQSMSTTSNEPYRSRDPGDSLFERKVQLGVGTEGELHWQER